VPRSVLLACFLAFVLAAGTALGPLEGIPHVTDEIAYTLQSRLFAAGMRTGAVADNASMVLFPFWQAAGPGHAVFPPGWPALLALGEFLGAAIWVNPLLCGLLPALTWALAREVGSPAQARLAAMLMALSPGVWMLGASRMAHTSVLVALLGLAAVVWRRREGTAAWWAAGGAFAYVVLARPFDAAVVGAPLALAGCLRCPRALHRVALLAPAGVALLILGLDNLHLTGSATTFPVGPWFDAWVPERPSGCNRLGFGQAIGCHETLGSWGHGPAKAGAIAGASLLRLDRLLLGIPGGLLLVALGVFTLQRRSLPLLGLGALVVGAHALYWSPGIAFGARFYHPLHLFLPLFLAVGAERILKGAAWAILAIPLATAGPIADGLRGYWCVDGALANQLEERGFRQGVLFLQGAGEREAAWPDANIASFTCTPLLEAGDGFHLWNPSTTTGGLQVRHALRDPSQARRYLRQLHPGAQALIRTQDVARNSSRLEPLETGTASAQ
jgi:hypothetical protein